MAGTDRRSSLGVDRRASMRLSMQQTDDDDDYDLEAMGISDGFRPAVATDVETVHIAVPSHVSQQSGRRTPPPRPSSISKPRGLDSFALRHDGAMGPNLQRVSTTASNAAPTRSSSISTDVPFMRAESPYRGPAGPSHPYHMYPQESRLARTASVATTSTAAVSERPYNGPGGPTHPYGMYPQNTVPEGEVTTAPLATVPVGFPGLQSNYQRRLGPDGEEIADIIGPDGHTEQLPPYTQYPDEAFARKARPNVQLPTPIPVPVPVPVAGAGGIGLATRNPEFESQEDLHSPSRQSTRSIMSDQSSHQVNMAALGASEKPELKKWQQIARRKVCGIVPIWALVLAAAVLVLFGMILGIVLAALKPKHPPPKHNHFNNPTATAESVVYTVMTTTFDATPMTASPTGLPPLPTGDFQLPITAPAIKQQGCLIDSAQASSWSCQIAMSTPYQISISAVADASSNLANNQVDLSYGNMSFNGWYAYGAQPPMVTSPKVLNLVIDSQDPTQGPAWFFEMTYDKLVILPENTFTTGSSSNSKRKERHVHDRDKPFTQFDGRKNILQPGDKPWFCYWNGTLLETFIYTNKTSSAGSRQSSLTMTGASSAPTSTSITQTTSTFASSVPTNIQTSGSSYSGSSGTSYQNPYLLAFPKVLKIEERRVPRGNAAVQPYCIQKIIDPNGNPQPYISQNGQPSIVYLNETAPSAVSQIPDKRDIQEYVDQKARDLTERQDSSSCGCAWIWT